MDVVENVQKVGIGIDVNLLRATLKKVPGASVSLVEVLCVPYIKFSHKYRDTILNAFRKEQMIVVLHQAPPMNVYYAIIRITTYDVVIPLEKIGRIICGGSRIENAETMNEPKSIAVVKKNILFFNTPIKNVIQLHGKSIT